MRVFNLCLELMSINSVLVIFKVSLFALNQLGTLSKSWCKYNRNLSTQSPAYVRWASSAYILGSQLDKHFGRSLIYNRNSSVPRIVPCGTPQVRERLLDNDPLMEHICVQFSKYDLNQLHSFPQMPQWLYLNKRILRSTAPIQKCYLVYSIPSSVICEYTREVHCQHIPISSSTWSE